MGGALLPQAIGLGPVDRTGRRDQLLSVVPAALVAQLLLAARLAAFRDRRGRELVLLMFVLFSSHDVVVEHPPDVRLLPPAMEGLGGDLGSPARWLESVLSDSGAGRFRGPGQQHGALACPEESGDAAQLLGGRDGGDAVVAWLQRRHEHGLVLAAVVADDVSAELGGSCGLDGLRRGLAAATPGHMPSGKAT